MTDEQINPEDQEQIIDEKVNNEPEQLDNEPQEDNTDDVADEEVQAKPEDAKPKGRSRNQRKSDTIVRQAKTNEDLQARILMLESQVQNPQQQTVDGQPPSNPASQSNLSQFKQQARQQAQISNFGDDVKDLMMNDDEANDILNDPAHTYSKLPQNVVQQLAISGVKPNELLEINKMFPKQIKRMALLSPQEQYNSLIKLTGRLEQAKENKLNTVKAAPEPTGVLNGSTTNVMPTKSPADNIVAIRKSIYG